MNENNAVILDQDAGEAIWVLGDLYTFKVTGKETKGAYTIIDQVIQPQNGPPPHIHHAEDEAFYVVEGRFSFLCGEKEVVLGSGSFAYVPKGTLHTFKNIDNKAGRLLVTITPAGLEEFFYAIGSVADNTTPPQSDPSIFEKIMRLAPKYRMELVM
jgi:mannose-6-phosphate isomerase-like protein (cupin superfamily)